MANPQLFTLEAVNAMIPELNLLMEKQQGLRGDIEARLGELCELLGDLPEDFVPGPSDSEPVRILKLELTTRVLEYQKGWQQLEDMGAVLKDPRLGLIDFYGRVDGKLVWLCWKFGETEVTHYHALDDGFTGRKEIRSSLKQRLLN